MTEGTKKYLNEDTLVAIHMTLIKSGWSMYKKRSGKPGAAERLEIKQGQNLIPLRSEVDCLFMLRVGTIQMIPGKGQPDRPIQTVFHGNPTSAAGQRRDLPILGARHFFDRSPSSFDYKAVTNCVVYAIDSDMLVDVGTNSESRGDENMFVLMRETLINSDFSDQVIAQVLHDLVITHEPIESEFDLFSAADDVRSYPFGPASEVIAHVFRNCVDDRIRIAEEKGIESSIYRERSQSFPT